MNGAEVRAQPGTGTPPDAAFNQVLEKLVGMFFDEVVGQQPRVHQVEDGVAAVLNLREAVSRCESHLAEKIDAMLRASLAGAQELPEYEFDVRVLEQLGKR